MGTVFKVVFAQIESGRFPIGKLINAVREEQFSLRIDKIPFPVVFFRSKAAGRLESRAVRPAAEPVETGDGGIGFQIARLLFASRSEIRI